MPRRARLKIAGYPLHIIQRGNNRSPCFHVASDHTLFLGLLGELAVPHGCAVHAYVLMTNHVHLLLTAESPEAPSQLMKNLGQRYVQHFNKKYARTGSLWEGRFRSSIVDSETYLFRCQRYIELNPVRAGMVRRPSDYPWSSYHVNAGSEASLFVVPHPQYLGLDPDDQVRQARYRELFRNPVTDEELDEIRSAANGGFALGSPAFVAEIARMLRVRVGRGKPGRPPMRLMPDRENVVCPRFTVPEDGRR